MVLPSQYLAQAARRPAEPQKRLMMAVLQAVLDDCRGTAASRRRGDGPHDVRAYRQARAYVASDDRAWPFSFENICEAVGLDAATIRRGIEATAT